MTSPIKKFTELKSFNLKEKFVNLADITNAPYKNTVTLLALPGKYCVFESLDCTTDSFNIETKEVLILHESIDLSKSIKKMKWDNHHNFSSNNDNVNSTLFVGNIVDEDLICKKLRENDELIQISEDSITLDFLYNSNNGINYSTIKEGRFTKGFKIEVETLKNKVTRQLVELCQGDDLTLIEPYIQQHKKNINIHYHDDAVLYLVCQAGDEDLIKYLLFSPELKENAHFNILCFGYLFRYELPILESLIVDYNLPKSEKIKEFLKTRNHENTQLVEDMFEFQKIKQAHDSLNNALTTTNESKPTKSKI